MVNVRPLGSPDTAETWADRCQRAYRAAGAIAAAHGVDSGAISPADHLGGGVWTVTVHTGPHTATAVAFTADGVTDR